MGNCVDLRSDQPSSLRPQIPNREHLRDQKRSQQRGDHHPTENGRCHWSAQLGAFTEAERYWQESENLDQACHQDRAYPEPDGLRRSPELAEALVPQLAGVVDEGDCTVDRDAREQDEVD